MSRARSYEIFWLLCAWTFFQWPVVFCRPTGTHVATFFDPLLSNRSLAVWQLSFLEQRADELRKEIKIKPPNGTAYLELGMILQEMDHLRPDGGSLLPEAEHAYRLDFLFKGSHSCQCLSELDCSLI